MVAPSLPNRNRRQSRLKRVAFLGLLGLQVAVAATPLTEPHQGSLVTHAERDGAAHHFVVHNDATCAACSVRSLHASPSDAAAMRAFALQQHVVPVHVEAAAPSRDDTAANPSRAPPRRG